ncbi:hypothetical protein LJY25_09225 [Hymenobacter sp. BT175]|uniref:hypothetical protein n=1 Tax=Hymenobacter translucens TaxID=2886507 RepID=UPI001D0EF7FE|nr:hypothetical protein [Hymenobacter translucens]MCC2546622.1 hypothetical protein [Hymenobacter translucens]
MAFVQESLGHSPAALYYLSLAQARQPRKATWQKMAELAQNHRLTGYPDTWRQRLLITFRQYYYRLLQFLLIGAVVGGLLLLMRRRNTNWGWWAFYCFYLVAVGLYLNLLAPGRAGIVTRPRAALMGGPSAGADWLSTAAAGDRLVVQDRQDIWYRVLWRGKDAYIRQHDLIMVQ